MGGNEYRHRRLESMGAASGDPAPFDAHDCRLPALEFRIQGTAIPMLLSKKPEKTLPVNIIILMTYPNCILRICIRVSYPDLAASSTLALLDSFIQLCSGEFLG